MQLFSERIRRRLDVWWGGGGLARRLTAPRPLHRLRELIVERHHDDPEARWRCCEHWQRALTNKWNAREFARRYGVPVPTLYWYGRRTGAIPVAALPEAFVVRAVHGTATRSVRVFAGECELLGGRALPRQQIAGELRRTYGRIARWPLLVEQFAASESGALRLPTEYKCYTFAGRIGVIVAIHRTRHADATMRFYTPDWEPITDRMHISYPQAAPTPPPACLDEIRRCAETLSAAYGTFVRVDFFATPAGCLFTEFATTPVDGTGYTPWADAMLGALWQSECPDRI